MAPLRTSSFKRIKRTEKKVDQNVLAFQNSKASQDWWDRFCNRITSGPLSGSINSMTFESLFKISIKTFNYICSLVADELRARQYNLTDSNGKRLSLRDQVAIALRRLVSGESLANIGDSFGINQSTVASVTWRFVEAMEEKGLHHLQWPSTEAEIAEIKSKFEKLHGLLNCCGVIDTTHILMNLPALENDVWIDREKKYSMVLQAIVDPDMRFRNVTVGYPGSVSDALVLQDSTFFKLIQEGKRLNGKKMQLSEGTKLGEYIIGDAGFPLMPWLLTPYQCVKQDHEVEFNKRHSATRLVAQSALARLKELWRNIHGVMWMPDKNRLPRLIFVCCMLHNIVIDMDDKVLKEMPMSYTHDKDYRQQICESASTSGADIREKLSRYLSGPPPPVDKVRRNIESTRTRELPFRKTSLVWEDIESMKVFKSLPQKPHFSPLAQLDEASREGLAMRHMMTFATLVENISKLRVENSRIDFQSYLDILGNLEKHGFNVKPVVDRLSTLLKLRDRHAELKYPFRYVTINGERRRELIDLDEDTNKTEKSINGSRNATKDSAGAASQENADIISTDSLKNQFAKLVASPW